MQLNVKLSEDEAIYITLASGQEITVHSGGMITVNEHGFYPGYELELPANQIAGQRCADNGECGEFIIRAAHQC